MEGGKPSAEIEKQPRGPRIAVARLSYRARIEEPTSLELHFGAPRSESADDLAAVLRDRECNMAVTDEDDGCRRQFKRGACRFLGQNVLPDRIARARVKEVNAMQVSRGFEAL